MKALINIYDNVVYEVVEDHKTFAIAHQFAWVDCGDEIRPYAHKLINGVFVNNENIAAAEKEAALAALSALDLQSIRAMREYIAAQPDAPQILKDRETAAQVARAKLK